MLEEIGSQKMLSISVNVVNFFAAKCCENLRELNLSGMNISNKGLQTLADKCRKLEVINLSYRHLTRFTVHLAGLVVSRLVGATVAELTGYLVVKLLIFTDLLKANSCKTLH